MKRKKILRREAAAIPWEDFVLSCKNQAQGWTSNYRQSKALRDALFHLLVLRCHRIKHFDNRPFKRATKALAKAFSQLPTVE